MNESTMAQASKQQNDNEEENETEKEGKEQLLLPLQNHVGGKSNIKECFGDCDNDNQCAGKLKCRQRSGYTTIPGCSGQGTNNWS